MTKYDYLYFLINQVKNCKTMYVIAGVLLLINYEFGFYFSLGVFAGLFLWAGLNYGEHLLILKEVRKYCDKEGIIFETQDKQE